MCSSNDAQIYILEALSACFLGNSDIECSTDLSNCSVIVYRRNFSSRFFFNFKKFKMFGGIFLWRLVLVFAESVVLQFSVI